jgi:hypothetical protein
MQDKNEKKELEVMNYLSKGDQFVFYVFRKASKISYAVYAITDLIKDAEPLKWTLRKTATDISSLRNFFDEKSVFNNLERTLLELESLLDLASFAKVVSEMNSYLLQSEIRKMIAEMRDKSKEGFYSPELVESFFDIPKPEVFTIAPVAPSLDREDYSKGHKRQDVRYARSSPAVSDNGGRDFYGNDFSKKTDRKNEIFLNRNNNATVSKGQRSDQIIDIIMKRGDGKGSVTIKDITDKIRDCSEKTIQRELISMVANGVLKKTGERRWSTYSLR